MTETRSSYFTEIEDHFRATRGTSLFLFSPLDWALMEAWKGAGIPLEAVLRGIDLAFERWRKQPARARTRMVNSLAYCTQAIAEEAQSMANAAPFTTNNAEPPFSLDDICGFVRKNAAALRTADHCDLAGELESLDLESLATDLEQLEQHLTAIEGKMIARLRGAANEEVLSGLRRELDRDLKPYRGKMTTDQLAMLEKQFLERKLLESAGLPRLSLFYL
jgi:hypothetical protein